jgi:hypothetical protein
MDMVNPNLPRTATEMLQQMMKMGAKTVKFDLFAAGKVTVTFDMHQIDKK